MIINDNTDLTGIGYNNNKNIDNIKSISIIIKINKFNRNWNKFDGLQQNKTNEQVQDILVIYKKKVASINIDIWVI